MTAAVVVVDMLVDNVQACQHGAVGQEAARLVPILRELLGACRSRGARIIYANDSFLREDAVFGGRMAPHALRGTPGARVVEELAPEPGDLVVPKRRFSAFYKTDLDQTLRTWKIDTVVVCGITTPFCILATALDAVAHDFCAIILEDASAAHKPEVHRACLDLYRRSALWPLLRVADCASFLAAMDKRGLP